MTGAATSHRVEVGDLQVHYWDQGAGTPVVLLHGGLATAEMSWTETMPALARRFRVVAPDARGHGGTDNPAPVLGYDQMADDLAGLVARLDLDRPFVAGYSDGAQVALELALRHPGLARGIVLGGTVSEPHDVYVAGLHAWGFPAPGEVDLQLLEREFGDEFYAETRTAHEHVRDDASWRRFLEQISALWLGVPRYEETRLATITDPVLVITGDRDEMAGLAQAERLYRGIPGAELAVVPDADHGAADRRVYWALVEDFLDRHGAAG
ncbi:MAG TPA: alpha/beta hydrolase [Acidimicrobiales bacterium]|jgi:pimeloyl-ACP methyl ester carboxylesterase|nr:alpha/beta hydrolase [Acidimicrobiales bacterium]